MKPLPVKIAPSLIGGVADRGLAGLMTQVKDGIDEVKKRIAGAGKQTRHILYNGMMVFTPEANAFALDTLQTGAGTTNVNYVVKSGATYQIPVQVGADGVFLALGVRCIIRQLLSGAQKPVFPMTERFDQTVGSPTNWTTKFSLGTSMPATGQAPSINYRWNLQNGISNELYSDEFLPASAMMERSHATLVADDSVILTDGTWHRFRAPWRFDQAQRVSFLFRPVTDIVQAAVTGNPGSPVTVHVELAGEIIGGRK
jgi:hypothetical protein